MEKDEKIISLITLTPAESKRLIARYIACMPQVKYAMKNGLIDIQLSSTNGYIYEELSGHRVNKSAHLCGCITAGGGCQSYLPSGIKRECYFDRGEEKHLNFPSGDFAALFERMGEKDIIIKSGNLLDQEGKAYTFIGEPSGNGGEWGTASRYALQRNITVLVPMTLNKSAHVSGRKIMELLKLENVDWDKTHVLAELVEVRGTVITELEALKELCGVEVEVAAMSGVSSGEGTVTLCIYGSRQHIDQAWDLVTSIKGEPALEIEPRCGKCLAVENHGICVAQKRNFTRG